jgi:hypothetical protein
MKITHSGRLGLIPVWIGNLDSSSPYLTPRYGIPELALEVQVFVYQLIGAVLGTYWLYPIHVARKLEKPFDVPSPDQ